MSASIDDLLRARMDESGVPLSAAREAGLVALSKEKTAKLWSGAPRQDALRINYLSPSGKSTGFYRVRLLGEAPGFKLEKPLRYLQPPGSGVHAYLPRVKGVEWLKILSDPEEPLILTEGEIKALSATVHGFPTIGIGGVENWHSAKEARTLLEELEAIAWDGRAAYICYDSDVASKPQVAYAAQRLASELARHGAVVYDAGLPGNSSKKVGLDDFLVMEGEKALERHLSEAQPFASVKALHEFNSRFIFIRSSAKIFEVSTQERYDLTAFKSGVEANATYPVQTLDKKGDAKIEIRSTAADWIKWPHRRTVQRQDYLPGVEDLVVRRGEELVLNIWRGWGVKPKKGSVEPWTKLLDFLTGELQENEREPVRRWMTQWFAYPLQNPGAKLYSAIAVWGAAPGTGKTLLGETALRIYGDNGQLIEAEHLEASFNSWARGKQFILGDEITGSDSRGHADKLKGLITGSSLLINEKFEKPYNLPNTLQFYFTSNHPDAFFIDKDRRFLVIETPPAPMAPEFYRAYRTWMRGDGPAFLFHHLLGVSLDGFNPQGPPPVTSAKEVMADQSLSDVGRFVSAILQDPSQAETTYGIPPDIDLFSPNELHKFYDPRGEKRATVKAISLELQKQGAPKVLGGRQVDLNGTGHFRFYAVRNMEKWRYADSGRVRKYVTARELPTPKF